MKTNLQVLIADDDQVVNAIHKTYIKKSELSLNPLSFRNGQEVLDYLNANNKQDEKYLIFLDINMPVINGWEFLDKLISLPFSPNVHVIFVTSSINKRDKEKAETYQNTIGFFEKPIKLNDCLTIMDLPQISSLL